MKLNAHGCGIWRGWKCTNCAEALDSALRHQFHAIEVDVSVTKDNVFVLGQEHPRIAEMDAKQWRIMPTKGGGTPMTLTEFLARVERVPELRIMVDFHPGWEFDCPDELKRLSLVLNETIHPDRFLLEAYSTADANAILQTPFKNAILWMANRARRHDSIHAVFSRNAAFCRERGIRFVSVPRFVLETVPDAVAELKQGGVTVYSTGWDDSKALAEAARSGVDFATVDESIPCGFAKNVAWRFGNRAIRQLRRVAGPFRRICQHRRPKAKRVFLVGVFDMLHYGHFELFRRAKALAGPGGKLMVAVQDDDYVLKYKPEAKIVIPLRRRIKMISALRYVDRVEIYTDVDEIVQEVDFDVFVVGEDQNHAGFRRAVEWCESNGRNVVRLPRTPGVSSTELRKGVS